MSPRRSLQAGPKPKDRRGLNPSSPFFRDSSTANIRSTTSVVTKTNPDPSERALRPYIGQSRGVLLPRSRLPPPGR